MDALFLKNRKFLIKILVFLIITLCLILTFIKNLADFQIIVIIIVILMILLFLMAIIWRQPQNSNINTFKVNKTEFYHK
jgi:hypothetical protein